MKNPILISKLWVQQLVLVHAWPCIFSTSSKKERKQAEISLKNWIFHWVVLLWKVDLTIVLLSVIGLPAAFQIFLAIEDNTF